MQQNSPLLAVNGLLAFIMLVEGAASTRTGSIRATRLRNGQTNNEKKEVDMPFPWLYDHADEVAKDLELRRGAEFIPEGSVEGVDVSANEAQEQASIFDTEPSVFKNCILIRDDARPLRVGSAISMQHGNLKQQAEPEEGSKEDAKAEGNPEKDEAALPPPELLPKGGVTDINPESTNASLIISMFAYLESVSGEVSVIPNGVIAKWSSKKRVPLAGYLCASPEGPVLHTLPTPCIPTALDENGQPQDPPPQPGNDDAEVPSAPAPAAPAAAQAPGDSLLQRQPGGPSSAPAASPAANEGHQSYTYNVWIGRTELSFSSKPRAERFCKRYAEEIAKDLGDTEWIPSEAHTSQAYKDMEVSEFVQMTRQVPSAAWTQGTKSLLVVVMDWMAGDRTRAPLSKQTLSPAHYRDRIFPRVNKAFQTMSHGRFGLKVDVLPEVIRYTRPRSRYTSGGYPFPGLYNGAKESLDGNRRWGNRYSFDTYDLVYVINPQQAPTGTKGVAWVGAKGAICNGCEEISENFQVMVAVHELGHNLGLSHASSKSLEYGNPYDWMGNYPDVQGLFYGLGYQLALDWVRRDSVIRITDADLPGLSDLYLVKPFDVAVEPSSGHIVGVHISLRKAARDLFVSFRSTTGAQAGVVLTYQDKDKPNSELVDCACHTPSQRDAALQPGWTYIDPTNQIVITTKALGRHVAKVHIYSAPTSSREVAAIRGRYGFTDGAWKCPRSCTDSDLLISQYGGCAGLKRDGYCRGGSITMSGKKLSIDKDLCPQSCGKCDDALKGTTLVGGGCQDRNIRISGKSCSQAARGGFCKYSTNIGHVGIDICPRSCGNCPARPSGSTGGHFPDPSIVREHGKHSEAEQGPGASPEPSKEEAEKEAEQEEEKQDEKEEAADKAADEATEEEEAEEEEEEECMDDPVWKDPDGDGCKTYSEFIKQKKLTRAEACGYGGGAAKAHCRATCNTCTPTHRTCVDKQCVAKWHRDMGQCYSCGEWPKYCDKAFFKADCPHTCGLCHAKTTTPPPAVTTAEPTTTTTTTTQPPTPVPPVCRDSECVDAWVKEHGKCFKCENFADEYCGRDEEFVKSCPLSCKLCTPNEKPQCADDFKTHTCQRYSSWGWCSLEHVAEKCRATCGLCTQEKKAIRRAEARLEKDAASTFAPLFLSIVAVTLSLPMVC